MSNFKQRLLSWMHGHVFAGDLIITLVIGVLLFGVTTPVIGAIMNFLIFKVFFRKKANWQLIRDDMILDNRYLYDILTEGKYPERIPLDKLLTGAK